MPVEIVRRGTGRKFSVRRLEKMALALLPLVGEAAAELSIALIGNAEMRKLNAKYRRRDYPTDVLSFPVEDSQAAPVRLLGDVVISVERAREQAQERGRTVEQEIATLLIHGTLHLLGHDHERSAAEARKMKRLENKIYRRLCEQGLIRV
jgi:probable rRNA maturation factor